jgi:hypothetical protein
MSADEPKRAACPKCRKDMIYVIAVPHPQAPEMLRTTFVCYPCNRTWNYSLARAMAEAYAPDGVIAPLEPRAEPAADLRAG